MRRAVGLALLTEADALNASCALRRTATSLRTFSAVFGILGTIYIALISGARGATASSEASATTERFRNNLKRASDRNCIQKRDNGDNPQSK